MPRCVLPLCGRDELPPGPGMPPGIGIPCAHVTKTGTPCPSSFGESYDAEAKQVIVTEDALWNLPDIVEPPSKREEPPPTPKRKGKAKTVKPAPAAAEKAPPAVSVNVEEDEVDRWQP